MKFVKVESSTVAEVGYDYENKGLEVHFKNGREYIYENVPVEVYAKMLEADSKGKYLNESVIGRYTYARTK